MEMPRFCRKHPKLMAPLFDKMVDMVGKFEGKLLEQQSRAEQERQKQERQQQQQAAQGKQKPDNEVSRVCSRFGRPCWVSVWIPSSRRLLMRRMRLAWSLSDAGI